MPTASPDAFVVIHWSLVLVFTGFKKVEMWDTELVSQSSLYYAMLSALGFIGIIGPELYRRLAKAKKAKRSEFALINKTQCQAPKRLQYDWPFGIDLVRTLRSQFLQGLCLPRAIYHVILKIPSTETREVLTSPLYAQIIQAFSADRAGKILSFFLHQFERTANTFEQIILGGRGIGTQDPENIEAILSTQFHGQSPPIDQI